MKLFKVDAIIETKEGFDINILKQKLEDNLKEVRYNLIGCDYTPKNYEVIPEIPALNKVIDTFTYYVEVHELFDYRIALSCFMGIPNESYDYFQIYSIEPNFIENN